MQGYGIGEYGQRSVNVKKGQPAAACNDRMKYMNRQSTDNMVDEK